MTTANALRVVLDTNVLVSLWVFEDARHAAMLGALADGRWQALGNDACLAEFERVLGYPQFALGAERRHEMVRAYRALMQPVAATAGLRAPLPLCRDADDQKFLELARDGAASWLITADRALLRMARRNRLAHLFGIITPDVAIELLAQEADLAA